MLYVRKIDDDMLLIYDNPLVRYEFKNINAFVVFMNNQKTFYKFYNIKNGENLNKIIRENYNIYN